MLITRTSKTGDTKYGVACDHCGRLLAEVRYRYGSTARQYARKKDHSTERRVAGAPHGISADYCAGCADSIPASGWSTPGLRRNKYGNEELTLIKVDNQICFSCRITRFIDYNLDSTARSVFSQHLDIRFVGPMIPALSNRLLYYYGNTPTANSPVSGRLMKNGVWVTYPNLEPMAQSPYPVNMNEFYVNSYFWHSLNDALQSMEPALNEHTSSIAELLSESAATPIPSRRLYLS